MKNYLIKLIILAIFLSPSIKAATVSCNFMSGEAYSISSGAWIGTAGYEDIWDIFGDGLSLPMENSLLATWIHRKFLEQVKPIKEQFISSEETWALKAGSAQLMMEC